MEVSGFLSRRVSCFPGVAVTAAQSSKPSIRVPDHRDSGVSFGLRSTPSTVKTGFRDLGHLEYYSKVPIRCGGKKKKDKKDKEKVKEKDKTYGVRTIEKKLTLLEALSISNNLNADMDHQVHNNMISEASNELLTQLEQLRAEEKELKMKRKQLKAKLKAERMASMMHCESSSSSSSSESSDSECDEMVDMKQLRSEPISQPLQEDNGLPPIPEDSVKLLLSLPSSVTTSSTDALIRKGESELGKPSISSYGSSSIGHVNGGGFCNKVVEVCMGNKCKKSGSVALVEEFERVMGAEGAVVGCKCMGKCKSGPNVRVLNRVADESVRTVANPLCIGVGLEDVNHIVANLFREDTKDMGLAAAV